MFIRTKIVLRIITNVLSCILKEQEIEKEGEMEMEMEMEMENVCDSNNKKDDEVLLPGFRFHPTDEELVGFYLSRKVEKKHFSIELIKQVDIYKYDPWDLPKVSTVGDKEWYFFCIRGRKYRNSIRPNRVTGSGFWKATGIDKPIFSVGETNNCIGLKKSLVYYKGSAGKGTKTDWMLHEFRLPTGGITTNHINAKNMTQEAEIWTLCRIFKRSVPYRKYTQDLRETSSKQSPNDSSSRTCSFESDNRNQYKSFGDSVAEQNEKKPVVNHIDKRIESSMNQLSSIPQAPFTTLYSTFPNPNTNEFLRKGNWDELGSVVELATDPTLSYGCE